MGDSDDLADVEADDESYRSYEITENPQFTDKLYKEVPKERNVLISPISIEILLAMIYQGVTGETAEKLVTILDVENQNAAAEKYKCVIERFNGITNMTLAVANQIFMMKDFPIKAAFETVIEEAFMSKIGLIDFSDSKKASDEINQWVEDRTKNTIKNVISPDSLDHSVRLVLLNALYFKPTWEKSFLKEDTTMQPFFISEHEAVDCEMMFVTSHFNYISFHQKMWGQVLELPCKGKELSMLIILPCERRSFAEMILFLENELAKVELSKLMQDEDVAVEKMEVFLPKFKIETTTDVKPLLEKMGLEAIFDPNTADCAEMSERSKSLYVSQFLQKTCIEIDEEVTETAATTESMEASVEEPTQFIVNHPFMFVLQVNGKNGENTVLFVGKVVNPIC